LAAFKAKLNPAIPEPTTKKSTFFMKEIYRNLYMNIDVNKLLYDVNLVPILVD
jgi:hypothetical protein